MNTREQRNCAKCGGPIPSKNKQDCCDDCIAQAAGWVGVAAKVGSSLLPAAVFGIARLVLKLKRK